jgi:hypothetical protein
MWLGGRRWALLGGALGGLALRLGLRRGGGRPARAAARGGGGWATPLASGCRLVRTLASRLRLVRRVLLVEARGGARCPAWRWSSCWPPAAPRPARLLGHRSSARTGVHTTLHDSRLGCNTNDRIVSQSSNWFVCEEHELDTSFID